VCVCVCMCVCVCVCVCVHVWVCVPGCFVSSFASSPPSLSSHFFSSFLSFPSLSFPFLHILLLSLTPSILHLVPYHTPLHPPSLFSSPSPLHPITGVTMWRSSQPKCGVSGTCTADEKLLDLIAQSCVFKRTPTGTVKATGDPLLCIIDCRPKVSGSGGSSRGNGNGSGSGSGGGSGGGTGSVIVITIICIKYQLLICEIRVI
jgi:uncharacterized membrane protein YgcG